MNCSTTNRAVLASHLALMSAVSLRDCARASDPLTQCWVRHGGETTRYLPDGVVGAAERAGGVHTVSDETLCHRCGAASQGTFCSTCGARLAVAGATSRVSSVSQAAEVGFLFTMLAIFGLVRVRNLVYATVLLVVVAVALIAWPFMYLSVVASGEATGASHFWAVIILGGWGYVIVRAVRWYRGDRYLR